MTGDQPELNWIRTGVDDVAGLPPIDWDALAQYATEVKSRRENTNLRIPCRLSPEYNMGGLNLVRLVDFQNGTRWVARIQLDDPAHSPESLTSEADTMALARERSIPVPEVYALEAAADNPVGAPFMLMGFVPGDTAVDTAGGYAVHGGMVPARFRDEFYSQLADIQVHMSAVRFPRIGRIIKSADGSFGLGPLPRIGGPFNSAREFFEAWACRTAFPHSERLIRGRIPTQHAEEDVLTSIKSFPSRVAELAKSMKFCDGPFPLYHTDFYSSNIIVDSEYNILSVIDWEGAYAAPWELVEIAKDLSITPPAMEIPLQKQADGNSETLLDRRNYVGLVRRTEESRGLDKSLSATLGSEKVQDLASAMRLYEEGRIGYYGAVLDALGKDGASRPELPRAPSAT